MRTSMCAEKAIDLKSLRVEKIFFPLTSSVNFSCGRGVSLTGRLCICNGSEGTATILRFRPKSWVADEIRLSLRHKQDLWSCSLSRGVYFPNVNAEYCNEGTRYKKTSNLRLCHGISTTSLSETIASLYSGQPTASWGRHHPVWNLSPLFPYPTPLLFIPQLLSDKPFLSSSFLISLGQAVPKAHIASIRKDLVQLQEESHLMNTTQPC